MRRARPLDVLSRAGPPEEADQAGAVGRGQGDILEDAERVRAPQVAICLRAERGARIADKTALKMMGEMGLRCGIRRETGYHRYNSYGGPVGETFESALGCDFASDGPWRKMGTDVTEFRCSFGKAYLAPAYDFGSREIAAWSISESPDMAQQEEMLDMPISRMPEGARPVLQSDMGWQYQSDRYVSRLQSAGIVQSMSRKGNCLDNAYTEGLFGHMKDEFFRGRDWDDFESFKEDLEDKEFPSKLLQNTFIIISDHLSRYDSPALIPIKPHIYFRIGVRKNCNDFLNKITRRTVVIRV